MKRYLHIRYNPHADTPGKWSIWSRRGCVRCNLRTFDEAEAYRIAYELDATAKVAS